MSKRTPQFKATLHDGPLPAPEFGLYLRDLRERQSLTLRPAAKRLGISYGYLCLIEHGKMQPSTQLIRRLAELYHVDANGMLETAGRADEQLLKERLAALPPRALPPMLRSSEHSP